MAVQFNQGVICMDHIHSGFLECER
jgi:hypothetical protein